MEEMLQTYTAVILCSLTCSSWQYQDTGKSLFLAGGSSLSIPGSHNLPLNKQKYVTSYTNPFQSMAV
jgi:hypothetical protein